MKRNLQTIASQLTEADLQELIRIKKTDDKKIQELRKMRDKLAADLVKVEAQLEKMTGDSAPASKPAKPAKTAKTAKTGKAGRPAKKAASEKAASEKKAVAKKPAKGAGKKRGGRISLSGAVRQVFEQAGAPLKASQVVDALPDAGIKVKSVQDMRKRISVILASQKNYFEQVDRGLYQLKS